MILDKVDNIDLYAGLGEKFKKAIDFIKATDLVSLAARSGMYSASRERAPW